MGFVLALLSGKTIRQFLFLFFACFIMNEYIAQFGFRRTLRGEQPPVAPRGAQHAPLD